MKEDKRSGRWAKAEAGAAFKGLTVDNTVLESFNGEFIPFSYLFVGFLKGKRSGKILMDA